VCITNVRIVKSSTFVWLLFVSKSFSSLLWTSRQKTARSAVFFFFLDSVTVNTVVHTESEACQKQWHCRRRFADCARWTCPTTTRPCRLPFSCTAPQWQRTWCGTFPSPFRSVLRQTGARFRASHFSRASCSRCASTTTRCSWSPRARPPCTIPTYTYGYAYIYIFTCIYMYIYNTHTLYKRIYIYITLTHIHPRTQVLTRAHARTHARTYTPACVYMNM